MANLRANSEAQGHLEKEHGASFYFVAGEESGDRHAANLWKELKKLYPSAMAYGAGGAHLKGAGQKQLFDLASHAVVGLTDVLWNYFKFRGFFHKIIADITQKKPTALILVDYPGFNLRLAKQIRKKIPSLPIIYYISPQVWAWKAGRSRLIRKVVDLLLVIFDFEKEWFTEHEPELKAQWVGHPLMDRWEGKTIQEKDEEIRRIAMMPGSREREISRHLPIMLETARQASVFLKDVTFVFLTTDETTRKQIEESIHNANVGKLNIETHAGYQLTHLCRCDLAMVASGSATLECCVAEVPMLILYKVNPLTFWVGQKVVKLPYIGMVNILAGEKVVPEFLQERAHEDHLVEAVRKMAENPHWRKNMQQKLREVAQKLGPPGAGRRTALAVRDFLNDREGKS